jgi:hypothetical protein
LQEWGFTPTLENLAVASHRMFPIKFAMVGWPQFPDINRTNRSVLQMRPKYRNLATSVASEGIYLNQNGIDEAKALIEKLGPPVFEGEKRESIDISLLKAERGSGKARSVHAEDLISRVQKSQLFNLYMESRLDEAETIHLTTLLDVYDHTPSREKRHKLKQLTDAAKELQDEIMINFLKWVSDRFHKYLNR